MLRLRDAIAFLKTIWGALAGAAILFPGAVALLGLPIAPEKSRIALWYPVLGSIFAAFGLLLLLAYGEQLKSLSWARRTAVRGVVTAAFCVFALLSLRAFLLDPVVARVYYDSQSKVSVKEQKGGGVIMRQEIASDSLVSSPSSPSAETSSERPDPLDVVALALFVATMTSLAVGFGALGLHSYIHDSTGAVASDES
jgi:hypothetical protein